MTVSDRAFASWAGAAALALCTVMVGVLAPSRAAALPPATGSKCDSSWVNNAGAMQCFIQGEEETRNGAKHPHYVACVGGDVFCCVDNDKGQVCEAQMGGRQASKGDLIRAILGAHRTMLTRMGRYTVRPGELTRVPVRGVQP